MLRATRRTSECGKQICGSSGHLRFASLHLCQILGVETIVENPSSTHIFGFPMLLAFMLCFGFVKAYLSLCMYADGPAEDVSPKPLILWSSPSWLLQMKMTCNHIAGTHRKLMDDDAKGVWISGNSAQKASEHYPKEFCRTILRLFLQHRTTRLLPTLTLPLMSPKPTTRQRQSTDDKSRKGSTLDSFFRKSNKTRQVSQYTTITTAKSVKEPQTTSGPCTRETTTRDKNKNHAFCVCGHVHAKTARC